MNTDTGRIYPPEEYEARRDAAKIGKSRLHSDPDTRAQEEFARAFRDGKIVEISDDVARKVQIGQRVQDRRAKRKAAKAARRKNRK